MRRNGKNRMRKVCALFTALAVSVCAAGCVSGTETKTGADAAAEETGGGSALDTVAQGETESAGMGRYVEKNVLETDTYVYTSLNFWRLEDGRIALYYPSEDPERMGCYLSGDNGETWEFEPMDWLPSFYEENYTLASAMLKDGTVVLCYSPRGDDGTKPYFMFVGPDGTKREFDMKLSDEEMWVRSFAYDEATGRLFASVFGDKIYEIDTEDGSVQAAVSVEGSKVALTCSDNLLMCMTTDGLSLYDLESKRFIETDVLNDFVEETYSGFEQHSEIGYNALAFFGEESEGNRIIYIAGSAGLHRYIIGGGAIEQVIDGTLSSLGDPSHEIAAAMMLDGQEFLVKFSDEKLVKFTYDATVSTLPSNKLTVYSLNENDTVRQAISTYQFENPDMYVEYEIGMEGNGVTRDDALKKLSTALLDGSGPDVLILDDMPMDSYIDKGILMDISGVVEEIDETDGLYRNLMEPFYEDGSLYAVPAAFSLPVIGCHEEKLDGVDSYEGIADLFEELRAENPGKKIVGQCEAGDLLKRFIPVCAPAWKAEDGSVDEAQIRVFLEQSRRMYTAQVEGLSQDDLDWYNERTEGYEKENGSLYRDGKYFYMTNDVNYMMGEELLLQGNIAYSMDYNKLNSIPKVEGFADAAWKPMSGQSGNVYVPNTLIGVNAAASDGEQAQAFVRVLLGEEVQEKVSYGMPVNKKAFEAFFTVDPNLVDEDGAYLWCSSSSSDGRRFEYVVYAPTEEQKQRVRDWTARMDTPYIADKVLEDAVIDMGGRYLIGEIGLDDAMAGIMDSVGIYLAE